MPAWAQVELECDDCHVKAPGRWDIGNSSVATSEGWYMGPGVTYDATYSTHTMRVPTSSMWCPDCWKVRDAQRRLQVEDPLGPLVGSALDTMAQDHFGLVRGPAESDAAFRVRISTALTNKVAALPWKGKDLLVP